MREEDAAVDEDRLLSNPLSSMPLAVNLFGPLALDIKLGSKGPSSIAPGFCPFGPACRLGAQPGAQRSTLSFRSDCFRSSNSCRHAPRRAGHRLCRSQAERGLARASCKVARPLRLKHFARSNFTRIRTVPSSARRRSSSFSGNTRSPSSPSTTALSPARCSLRSGRASIDESNAAFRSTPTSFFRSTGPIQPASPSGTSRSKPSSMRSMLPATKPPPTAYGSGTATSSGSMTRRFPYSRQSSARRRSQRASGCASAGSSRRGSARKRLKQANDADAGSTTRPRLAPMLDEDLLQVEDRVRLLVNALADDRDPFPVVKLFTPDAGATWLITECDPDEPIVYLAWRSRS